MSNGHLTWTPKMDAAIINLWTRRTLAAIGAEIGCSAPAVQYRGRIKLGLPAKKLKRLYEPTRGAVLDAYRAQSGPAAPIKDILAGSLRQSVCIARWRAWDEILQTSPTVSIAGIARVAGYDHTTIISGLKRLEEIQAASQ